MKTIQCPYCGARFQVPETVTIAVCPYCGTTVWQASGEIFKEHYMFELRVEFNKAFDYVRRIAQRQFAAPDDIGEKARPEAGRIHFVPLYLYQVKVRAECPENPEAGLEEKYRVALALRNPLPGLPRSYPFPVRGRRFFEPATLERGKYHQPDLDPEELLEEVASRARSKALREALNTCPNPKLVDESKWLGIVHFPVWEVEYSYQGKRYRALVDGSEGTVIYLEYPIGVKERGILLSAGIGGIIASALIGAGIGAAAHSLLAGAAGGFIASLPGAYSALRLGASRVGVYKSHED